MTGDQDRTIRLAARSSARGVYRTVLELPASKMEACAAWALQARQFNPGVQFRFEEKTGRIIRWPTEVAL